MADEETNLPDKTKRSLELLGRIKSAFEAFDLADLPRPPYNAKRSLEVAWALSVYVHSAILHAASLLGGFLELGRVRCWPGATIIARSFYELGAQSHYVHKHVSDWASRNQVNEMWDFLEEINIGSKWMNDSIATRLPTLDDFPEETDFPPEPRKIGKIMACFAHEVEGQRLANYSLLSEFAHPNWAAFSQHYVFEDHVVKFLRDPSPEEFPVVVTLVLVAAKTMIARLENLNQLVDKLSNP